MSFTWNVANWSFGNMWGVNSTPVARYDTITVQQDHERYRILHDFIMERYYKMQMLHYYRPEKLILDANSYMVLIGGNSTIETGLRYLNEFMGMEIVVLPVKHEVIELAYEDKQRSIGIVLNRRNSNE